MKNVISPSMVAWMRTDLKLLQASDGTWYGSGLDKCLPDMKCQLIGQPLPGGRPKLKLRVGHTAQILQFPQRVYRDEA